MANVGTAPAGKTLIGAGNGASPTFADIGTNCGLTAKGVVIAEGNSAFQASNVGTSGQVFMSNGAAINPSFQNGGATFATTYTADSGSATPSAANLNVLGSGSITTSGSGSTLTTQLTGLTNHAVLVGAGTTTITKLAVGTNGQVLIAATGADPAFATLTSSDSSITFTVGANSLSLQVSGGTTVGKTITGDTGGALSPTAGNWNILGGSNCSTSGSGSTLTINAVQDWTEVTGTSVSATVNSGYILNNAGLVTVNLPGTFAVGDEIKMVGKGSGLWVADAAAGDIIHFGSQDTSSGGTLTATNRYDCLSIVGTVANAEWTVYSSVGNLTVA